MRFYITVQTISQLAEIYGEVHQDSSDDTFVIPDTIQSERAQLFEKLFEQIIEAPEVVDPSRAEKYREAAAKKFAVEFINRRLTLDMEPTSAKVVTDETSQLERLTDSSALQ